MIKYNSYFIIFLYRIYIIRKGRNPQTGKEIDIPAKTVFIWEELRHYSWDDKTIDKIERLMVEQKHLEYQILWDNLSINQKKTLKLVLRNDGHNLFAAKSLVNTNIKTASVVTRCLYSLTDKEIIGYLAKLPFRPIPALPENFYPRDITYIPVVNFSAALVLSKNANFAKYPIVKNGKYLIQDILFRKWLSDFESNHPF